MDDFNNKDKVVSVFAAGSIFKALSSYKKGQLDKLDRRLLKGFYTTNRLELQHQNNTEDLIQTKGGNPKNIVDTIIMKVEDSPNCSFRARRSLSDKNSPLHQAWQLVRKVKEEQDMKQRGLLPETIMTNATRLEQKPDTFTTPPKKARS